MAFQLPPRIPGLLAVALALPAPVALAAGTSGDEGGARRQLRAERRTQEVVVDGRLTDAAWRAATPSAGFTQRDPQDGDPASQPTEVRVLYDEHAIYVGLRAFDAEPEAIRGVLSRRDVSSASDLLVVGFDSYLDRRTGFVFAVNPAGVQRDWMLYDDGDTEDPSWNAVWASAAHVDAQGWTAELRIPLSQLRFDSDGAGTWGFQVLRIVQRSAEESFWNAFPKAEPGVVSHFGDLVGLDEIASSGGLEVMPYAVAGASWSPGASDPVDGHFGIGTDLRHRFASNFVLSATLNPDFGQIEADPSVVNLSASETFFPEKRPFFLEGRDIFQMSLGDGGEELFYSRRIGAPPSSEPEDEHEPLPSATSIYGAAKISGKTSSGWSLGALSALTGREQVAVTREDGRRDEEVIEPFTNYNVLSLRRDFRAGRTTAAAVLTSVHRDLESTGLDFLHDEAVTGGLQVASRHFDDEYELQLRLYGSHVRGSTEALLETQEASRRYYQRPDADYLTLDPNRTSLSGWSAQYELEKIGGERFRAGIGGDTRSPGFEANDLGFQNSADYAVQWAWAHVRDDDPGAVWNNWYLNANAWVVYDYGKRHLNSGGNLNGHARLLSYWAFCYGIGHEKSHLSTKLLRGGPAVRGSPSSHLSLHVHSDHRKRVRGSVMLWAGRNFDGAGHNTQVVVPVTFEPRSNLEITLQPSVTLRKSELQYVDAPVDASDETHYLLAQIDQVTASLTLRGSYTFTPTLSLQAYAQPYISTGSYSDYKEPVDPTAGELERRYGAFGAEQVSDDGETVTFDRSGSGRHRFSVERPDFSFRQLRSTVVLRWELAPGSALFFVWSHDRTSDSGNGEFRTGPDLRALARSNGEHVLMVKLSYWIEPDGAH